MSKFSHSSNISTIQQTTALHTNLTSFNIKQIHAYKAHFVEGLGPCRRKTAIKHHPSNTNCRSPTCESLLPFRLLSYIRYYLHQFIAVHVISPHVNKNLLLYLGISLSALHMAHIIINPPYPETQHLSKW